MRATFLESPKPEQVACCSECGTYRASIELYLETTSVFFCRSCAGLARKALKGAFKEMEEAFAAEKARREGECNS